MKKHKNLILSITFLGLFAIFTILLLFVNVKPVGANNTLIAFANFNTYFHSLTGVNWSLYIITDWLSILPFLVSICFGIKGFIQLIKRKRLKQVDKNIIALGVFYIVVIAFYFTFENLVINYRSILINGVLEVSYPSSTTMLVVCVMITSLFNINNNKLLKILIILFTTFMVVGRILSGVHWITDIIGGLLLSIGLIELYIYSIKR